MRQATIVNADTGEVVSTIMAPADQIAANVSAGQVAVEGIAQRAQRFDFTLGRFVEHRPPAPEPAGDYEWSEEGRQWELRAEVAERRVLAANAQAEIERLEASQHRAFRELYLSPEDDAARRRVADIDTAIAEQRAIIRANSSPVT